jgi:type 1 glutamine amidotransferase
MLKRLLLTLLVAVLPAGVGTAGVNQAQADEAAEGFRWLFDGKDIIDWDGNPEFWTVEDGGVITGRTTAEKPTKGNTFLVWKGGSVSDFELRLQIKITGGNSGIQYRSETVPDQKWVIKGYQGDFDSTNKYTGILYEEKGRGILAQRGTKVNIPADGKPEVVGSLGDDKELAAAVKQGDWNDYTIIAQGNHLIHKINGATMVDVTDEDTEKGKKEGLLALQLHAGPPMTVQFRNIRIKHLSAEAKPTGGAGSDEVKGGSKKIVFVAGKPSHPYGTHEHNAGCLLLAMELEKAMPSYKTVVYRNGWPTEANAFEGADTIVMYCDGGKNHMVVPHLDEVDALAKKGVGIVCVHYGVEVEAGEPGQKFLDWIGGYFEADWSVNPHWTAKFEKFPDHPVARGLKPFAINDEWYYHMRFRPEMKGVTPILSALPSPDTLARPDGHHSGNPHVRKAVAAGEIQHVAWASENAGGGRGFGFTGGHDHWNWGAPDFRKCVLNAIVWTAKGEVPAGGVESPQPSYEQLEANFDPKKLPPNFKKEDVIKKIEDAGGRLSAN